MTFAAVRKAAPAAANPTGNGRMRRARQGGFTYLGALLLVALMGAALAAVGESWIANVRRDKEEQLLFVGGEFRRAIERYVAASPAGEGGYPRALEDLLADRRTPVVRRHLRKIYLDPMTGKAQWGLVSGPQGELMGVHSLHEGRPMKQAGFAPENASLADKPAYREWRFVFSPPSGPGDVPEHAGASPAGSVVRQ